MIKKTSLRTVLSVTAFSGWAQDSSPDTLVVTANRFQQPVNTVLAPTDIVTKDDINRWQSRTVLDVMRRLPGVDVVQYGGMGQLSSVFVRGTQAKHVLVLVDGIPMARSGISNDPDFNQIPVSIIERLEFIRGPRSAVYGSGAIGGVINIITRSDEEKSQLNAGVGSKGYQEYDGTFRHRFGNTVATLAGSYQTTDGFNVQPRSTWGPDSDKDGHRGKTFWGSVDHKFDDNFSGFLRIYSYTNNTDYDQGSFGSANGGDEHQLYNQNWDTGLTFNNGIYSSQLLANYQKVKDYNYNGLLGRYNDGTTLDNLEQRYLQWGNNVAVGQGAFSAGIDWKQERLFTAGKNYYGDYKEDRYTRDNTGLFISGQQQFGSVTVEASGREDKIEEYGWQGTWQTTAGWEFVENYRVTLSYGTGFLAPSLGQQHGAGRFVIAPNPDLKPEESRQWEAGLEGLTGPLDWRLSAYRYKIRNLITYFSDPVTFQDSYDNIASATVKGLEWTGSFDTGPLNHRVTYQYTDARDDEKDIALLRRAKQQVKYDLTGHIDQLEWNVTYQYLGKRYDTNSVSPYNRLYLGGLSTWDVSASYPVTSQLTVRGKIANLFDKEYETVYGYQTAGREYTLSGSYTF